jgi:hypothetical protein
MMRETAMLNGKVSSTVVPAPLRLVNATRPPDFSTPLRTTSMPTPRPERSDTALAVEKPGANTSITASSSGSAAARSLSSRPFSTALRRTISGSMPLPSSLTRMMTLSLSCSACRRMVPCGGLPAPRRASGVSMP